MVNFGLLKNIVGKDWKLILTFFVIGLTDLFFNHWIIEAFGFISILLLIGYIILATNNDVVLSTIDVFKGEKNEPK